MWKGLFGNRPSNEQAQNSDDASGNADKNQDPQSGSSDRDFKRDSHSGRSVPSYRA
eukprot:CAMPEP_0197827488 /NCGR_PEP_ID=MMETSP1437-20131217/4236_1 /TAXON_ID=49252 ORGANISM="Eucampia antarctica, Strain CCMP1452" /NCGR_SAMPLE_ID=MMETSP1437 /ASSEMBLY_ACC=CAM_ASM_001096 /LENGTH=55 /DNA_ID=CAMNT_0043428325 /DNA_START=225 /DNA_END=392 /DNA_ORIENTATION=+